MSDPQRRAPAELSPRVLQIAGLVLIFASFVFWAFTNRQSSLILGAGVTLATLAWIQRAWGVITSQLPQYDPPTFDEIEQRKQVREIEEAERDR